MSIKSKKTNKTLQEIEKITKIQLSFEGLFGLFAKLMNYLKLILQLNLSLASSIYAILSMSVNLLALSWHQNMLKY